jgi:hypothetical protein
MLSCQSPLATSSARQAAAMTAARTPPSNSARPTTTALTSHQGDSVSSDWSGFSSTVVVMFFSPSVRPERLLWAQSVTVVAARDR